MDSLKQVTAENIAVLSLLATVPEAPANNTPASAFLQNGSGERALTFERECDIVDNLAFLAAVSDDDSRVTAVCIEECKNPPGMKAMLAINKGDLTSVKNSFLRIFHILEEVSSNKIREAAEYGKLKDILFMEVISMMRPRIVSRLRFRNAQRTVLTHQKPSINARLTEALRLILIHHNPLDDRALATVDECRSFTRHFNMLEANSPSTNQSHRVLADIVRSANSLTTELPFMELINALPNCSTFCPDDRTGLVTRMQKIGRYFSTSEFFYSAARRLAVFRRIGLEVVKLPMTTFNPSPKATSEPSLAAFLERVGMSGSQQMLHSYRLPRKQTAVSTRLVQHAFEQRLHNAQDFSKIHAEIQIICYYDINPVSTRPRIISSSKSACFLCNLFARTHGKFHIARTHGRLYERWGLPNLTGLGLSSQETGEWMTIVQKFNAALEDRIRNMLLHPPRLIYLHPTESVFIQPPTMLSPSVSEVVATASLRSPELSQRSSGSGNEPSEPETPRTGAIEPSSGTSSDRDSYNSTLGHGQLFRGERVRRRLREADHDFFFVAGHLELFIGTTILGPLNTMGVFDEQKGKGKDVQEICGIEIEWLGDDEANRIRTDRENTVLDVNTMQEGTEINIGHNSMSASGGFYILLDTNVIYLKYLART